MFSTNNSLFRAALQTPLVLIAVCAVLRLSTPATAAEARYGEAVVAAAHPLAAEAGLAVLREGGNAVDALVATAFTLNVVEPHASGLGGGGFLVYHEAATGRIVTIDYREKAPAALRREHFLVDGKPDGQTMHHGGLAVAVPGTLKGLKTAHGLLGSVEFAPLLDAAIGHAENGFEISPLLAKIISDKLELLLEDEAMAETFLVDGVFPPDPGTLLVQRDLAETFRAIQRDGVDAIYGAEAAEAIAASNRARGGVMTADDIQNFRPRMRDALRGSYRGHDIVTVGPPSTGGVRLLQILGLLDRCDLSGLERDSPEMTALLVEAFDRSYRATDATIADPAQVQIALDPLLSDIWFEEAISTMAVPGMLAAAPTTRPASNAAQPVLHGAEQEPGNTTHISIVDRQGNMLAVTQTINYWFGSCTMVPGMGIVMNNEMYDFSFDLASVNVPAARKIPRSSIAPVIVLKEGKPIATLGTPGGARIPSALAQVIVNKIDFGMSLQEAIDAPRIHFDFESPTINFESRIADETIQSATLYLEDPQSIALRERGAFDPYFGGAQAVWVDETTADFPLLEGAADPRRDGTAVGF